MSAPLGPVVVTRRLGLPRPARVRAAACGYAGAKPPGSIRERVDRVGALPEAIDAQSIGAHGPAHS